MDSGPYGIHNIPDVKKEKRLAKSNQLRASRHYNCIIVISIVLGLDTVESGTFWPGRIKIPNNLSGSE